MTVETAQPCGCVVITDDSPVTINGANMRGIVANMVDVRRCAAHQADWDVGIKRFSDAIDREIIDRLFVQASKPNGSGASA